MPSNICFWRITQRVFFVLKNTGVVWYSPFFWHSTNCGIFCEKFLAHWEYIGWKRRKEMIRQKKVRVPRSRKNHYRNSRRIIHLEKNILIMKRVLGFMVLCILFVSLFFLCTAISGGFMSLLTPTIQHPTPTLKPLNDQLSFLLYTVASLVGTG